MIYIVGWGIMLLALLVSEITRNRSRMPVVFVISLLALLAVFRGAVGTDTNTYEWMLESVDAGSFSAGVEPSFMALGWFFKALTGSAVGAVRLFSLVLFLVILYYALHSNRNERFYLLSCFLPSFIYQYSMNTLRLGLASVFILLAFQYVRRYRYSRCAVLSVVALTFHYSSIANLAYLMVVRMRWGRWTNLLIGLSFVLVAGALMAVNIDYFAMKLDAYRAVAAPGEFSGLSKVALIAVMTLAVLGAKIPRGEKFKLLLLTVLLTGVSMAMASVSYAGLRFLDLISFVFPLAVVVIYNDNDLLLDGAVKVGLTLVGLIAMISSYRNYVFEAGQGPSPFLPYHLLDLFGRF